MFWYYWTYMNAIGNQAFSHDGRKLFPGLSYSKANYTFLKSLRKKESDEDKKGPDSFSRFDPGLQFSFFFIETLSIAKTRSVINKHGVLRFIQAKVIYTAALLYAVKGL